MVDLGMSFLCLPFHHLSLLQQAHHRHLIRCLCVKRYIVIDSQPIKINISNSEWMEWMLDVWTALGFSLRLGLGRQPIKTAYQAVTLFWTAPSLNQDHRPQGLL